MTYYPQTGCVHCSESCDIFKFWEISDNIAEMVEDRDIITMEG